MFVALVHPMKISIAEFKPVHRKSVFSILRDVTMPWGRKWCDNILQMYCLECSSPDFMLKYVALQRGNGGRRKGDARSRERGRAAGNVVGTILLRHAIDVYVIEFLAVRKGLRGEGVGTELVNHAEQVAKSKGAKGLRVDTASEFKHNISFYQKLGFEVGGFVKNYYERSDSQVFLTKLLS